MTKRYLIILVLSLFFNLTYGQVFSNKEVGKKNQERADSLKTSVYPYALPIWGKKATEKGFSLPYSAGLSVNYFQQESALIINDLFVGFNDGPMYDLDELIRFEEATARAGALTVRPDVWLFPFLNVYAILGTGKTSTEINAGVYLPDTSNVWNEVTTFSTTANFDATSFGFGLTPTMGVGGGWLALDMNMVWTDVNALDKPVFTFVFGPRLGKSFRLKHNPESNIAVWVGGFRVKFSSETNGAINLNEVLPVDQLQTKVDDGIEKVTTGYENLDEWWNGLSEFEQNNPINSKKYETANRALDKTGGILNDMDAALNDDESATVEYSLNKSLKDKWNFIVGSQYQINKHFMLRGEFGFLGSRTQFMVGAQYRFGL